MSRATIVFFTIACLILSVYAADVTIQVGVGGLSFDPQNAAANPGDTLVFTWSNGGTHSVVQSDSKSTCEKSSLIPGAFDSGPLSSGTFNYTVTETSGTIFYFCSIPGHCDAGMWGTVSIGDVSSKDETYPSPGAYSSGAPSSTESAPLPSSSSLTSAASTTSVTILTLLGLVSSMVMVAFSMQ